MHETAGPINPSPQADEAWSWPKCIQCGGWLCITSRPPGVLLIICWYPKVVLCLDVGTNCHGLTSYCYFCFWCSKQHTSIPTIIQPHSLMNKVWKLPLLQKWRLSKVDDYLEFLKLIVKRWSTSADHRPADRSKVTYYLCADQELSKANHKGCHVLLPSRIIPTHISPILDEAYHPLAMYSVT